MMRMVSIGIIFTPLTTEEWNLKEVAAGIAGRDFQIVHPADDYCVWFSSVERGIRIGIYFNGIVYYIKRIREEDVSSAQMLHIVREGFNFIQDSPLGKDYLRRVDLVVRGEQMEGFYSRKQEVIQEFGEKLFANPLFGEVELTASDIEISIKERPILSFASISS